LITRAGAADLIGDTEEMARKHYARAISERPARLTGIVRDALSSTRDNISGEDWSDFVAFEG
jgi:hypothetical protein